MKVSENEKCSGCPYETLSNTDAAYLAGLIDGEGCLCITKKKPNGGMRSAPYECCLVVEMSCEAIIRWLMETLGGCCRTHQSTWPGGKLMYRWVALTEHSICLVARLCPYLRVKKEQAKVFIAFRQGMDAYKLSCIGKRSVRIPAEELEKREALRLQMRALNA